jgi:hypothetical protein
MDSPFSTLNSLYFFVREFVCRTYSINITSCFSPASALQPPVQGRKLRLLSPQPELSSGSFRFETVLSNADILSANSKESGKEKSKDTVKI